MTVGPKDFLFNLGISLAIICGCATNAMASDAPADSPRASVSAPMASVSGAQTPSGLPVPRYVSLKYGEVNGRTGPSKQHPVAWRYSRRGLPVIVVAETEMWRKVRDRSGDESWMHKRTLDGRRRVIALQDVMLRVKPRESSKARAIAAKDTLLTLITCDAAAWCEVKADTGHKGYIPRKAVWGATPL